MEAWVNDPFWRRLVLERAQAVDLADDDHRLQAIGDLVETLQGARRWTPAKGPTVAPGTLPIPARRPRARVA